MADLRRICRIKDAQARPPGLVSERLGQHFGCQTRSAHAKQYRVGKSFTLDFLREPFVFACPTGFLLDAFAFGPPPHGGIAFGWDRICMLLTGAPSLREVIAFPKTGNGFDPLTGAPTPITPQQRLEASIDATPD